MLPTEAKERKSVPIATGVLDYFPLALAEVARVSRIGNEQHNPGQPLHWDKSKSTDHADCLMRHLIDRGKLDTDGVTHTAKVAWRALALLQTELENKKAIPVQADGGLAANVPNGITGLTVPDSTGYSNPASDYGIAMQG